MMDIYKVLKFPDVKGETLEEKIKNSYEKIGKYLIDHANELAKDTEENISGVDLLISLDPNDLVTLEKKVKYYIFEK